MAKLYMLESVRDTINTSFIIEDKGTLIVIDGGYPEESDILYPYLKKLGGVVKAWFLTHAHDDHISAIFTVLNKYDDIKVEKVYYTFPSDEFLHAAEPKQKYMTMLDMVHTLRETVENHGADTVDVKEGDVYEFGGIKVRVLLTYDESVTANPINNSSSVFRFEINGKSIMFLGDLGVEGGERLIAKNSHEMLKADYVQMAHHGQDGVGKEVYEVARPRFCLWCTPSWLWDNKGPEGYDTGNYKTIIVRGWISELHCAEKHYVMKDGTHVIDL